ncbi:hypothetical protein H5410_024459 [Solanum commersonii]|uniref:Uncharacterized protein n=1 Tax=Solanum commersonii TaxID=4109 RepID=A0A9J5ZM27_SOLCO|nr:hypothetical protein H5410_024459 [Solanum commersonii]
MTSSTLSQGMLASSLKPQMHCPTSWSGEMDLMSQFDSLHYFSMLSTHVISQQSTVLSSCAAALPLSSFSPFSGWTSSNSQQGEQKQQRPGDSGEQSTDQQLCPATSSASSSHNQRSAAPANDDKQRAILRLTLHILMSTDLFKICPGFELKGSRHEESLRAGHRRN